MAGLTVNIKDGAYEFHRDDEGNVTFVERVGDGVYNQIVIIPSDVWQRNWARLVVRPCAFRIEP